MNKINSVKLEYQERTCKERRGTPFQLLSGTFICIDNVRKSSTNCCWVRKLFLMSLRPTIFNTLKQGNHVWKPKGWGSTVFRDGRTAPFGCLSEKSKQFYHPSVWSFELLWVQSNQTTMESLSENTAPKWIPVKPEKQSTGAWNTTGCTLVISRAVKHKIWKVGLGTLFSLLLWASTGTERIYSSCTKLWRELDQVDQA